MVLYCIIWYYMVSYDLFNDLTKKEISLHFTVAGNPEYKKTDKFPRVVSEISFFVGNPVNICIVLFF